MRRRSSRCCLLARSCTISLSHIRSHHAKSERGIAVAAVPAGVEPQYSMTPKADPEAFRQWVTARFSEIARRYRAFLARASVSPVEHPSEAAIVAQLTDATQTVVVFPIVASPFPSHPACMAEMRVHESSSSPDFFANITNAVKLIDSTRVSKAS